MKDLYDQRSKVLHVRDTKNLQNNLLREYVRKSLRIYLDKMACNPGMTHDMILDELDYS